MSDRTKAFIVVLLTMSVCGAGSELLVRLFLPQNTFDRLLMNRPAMFRESDVLEFELLPGYKGKYVKEEFDTTITINSKGYRGSEFDLSKNGRFRVLTIGDSFTLGIGVEDDESYPARMEKILTNDNHLKGIEIVNAGFAAGFSPDTYYLYLKERGLKLQPDLILIGFFIGNDIDHGTAFWHKWVRTDGDGLPLKIENKGAKVDNGRWVLKKRRLRYRLPILKNSHLFHLAIAAGKGFKRALTGSPAGSSDSWNEFIYKVVYEERTDFITKKDQTLFRAMARVAAKEGIPLAVIMIPAREQVYPDEFGLLNNRELDLEKPQRIFAEFFQRERIPYLDLLPYLKARSKESEFYFRDDMHWNVKGHELASKLIVDFLVENNLFKRF